jgi:hypothetical protein
MVAQILMYLGDHPQGGQEMMNLDLAKHHLDTLGVLEEKTRGNLSPEEQKILDGSLYESRVRFINIASQFI